MTRARRPWRVAVAALLAIPSCLALWFIALDPSGQPPSPASPATVSIYDRRGALLYQALDPNRGTSAYAPLADIPPHLLAATVATEDASFYSNPGVDVAAVVRALLRNWGNAEVVSGGSTITQQLARNLYMSPRERAEQSVWRKLREAALALRLAARLDKNDVLSWYLNTAPYGHQAVGVDAAARVYFGKRVRDLDLAESALLAGLPQAPSAYDPFLNLSAARARQRVVLSLMARQSYITEDQAASAAAEPLKLSDAAFPIDAPHFVAYVQDLLLGDLGLRPEEVGGLRVYTTLDLGLQEVAESTVRRHVASLADQNVTNGALVAIDPGNGEILAMVGSADYFDRSISGQVNVALAPRQPGSSIKPVLYAAALERGLTPASVLFDVPSSFLTADGKSYAPENYDRAWHGPVSVRDALANSYNLPAVSVLRRVGIPAFLEMAGRAGLTGLASSASGDLSLALGSGEVRLLDLVSAYSALAAGGTRREPVAIERVEDSSGRVLWRAGEPHASRVTTAQVAYLLTSILSDDSARSPAFGSGSYLRLTRPAAAKTGTTTDWRDNWTVGYTPDLVAGVWVGNADNSPMRGVSGITGAAPIWHDFMEEALKGLPARQFEVPDGLARREVCALSGDLPSESCPERRSELFVPGTEPTAACDWHRPFLIDRATGAQAGAEASPGSTESRVFLVLPPELESWARGRGIPTPPPSVPGPGGEATPRLVLTSPAMNGVYQVSRDLPPEMQRLELSAAASGLDGASRVELRVDGAAVASLGEPPFRQPWTLSAGRHAVEALALDADGDVLASDRVEITVEPAPFRP